MFCDGICCYILYKYSRKTGGLKIKKGPESLGKIITTAVLSTICDQINFMIFHYVFCMLEVYLIVQFKQYNLVDI